MALVEEVKKGGPYTKQEQDERKQEVFKLHFEKGYSAVKITEKQTAKTRSPQIAKHDPSFIAVCRIIFG